MKTHLMLNTLSRLAGRDPLEVGDLADMPVVGRVQVVRLLSAMQVEVRTSKGDLMTVRKQVLQKVTR